MKITAAQVKELRDATGAGMMDAKRALEETAGDFEKAVEVLRVKGAAKAAKRGAERTASAGLVANAGGALVELNSETDFVAKSERFVSLANQVAAAVRDARADDPATAAELTLADGSTVADAITSLGAVIGEKIGLGRVAYVDGRTATYLHRRASDLPPAVGVLVAYEGPSEDAARDAAMQVAAMRPQYLSRADVPADVVAKEREIAEARAREEGRPEQALPKIVEGRVNAFFREVALLEQPSVHDPKRTVGETLAANGTTVTRFVRFEVGHD
ncbi:MAG TPA: translation elongation factor Ts [Nocardioidaceae bacterium]|nr:translation elongation factor Ts [Nocardioidaceae bacterium]